MYKELLEELKKSLSYSETHIQDAIYELEVYGRELGTDIEYEEVEELQSNTSYILSDIDKLLDRVNILL